MAVRFATTGDAYTSTTGLPSGSVATLLCWFKVSVDTNAFTYIWQLSSGGGSTTQAYLGTAGDGTTLYLSDSTGAGFGGLSVIPGTWARAAAVMNGTSWTLHIANNVEPVTTYSATMTAMTSVNYLALSGPFAFSLNGCLSNYKLYDAALNMQECETELAAFTPSRSSNLIRAHRLTSAELTDYSGNGFNLTAGSPAATAEDDPAPLIPSLSGQLRVPIQSIQIP